MCRDILYKHLEKAHDNLEHAKRTNNPVLIDLYIYNIQVIERILRECNDAHRSTS